MPTKKTTGPKEELNNRLLGILTEEFGSKNSYSYREFTVQQAQAAIQKNYTQELHQLYLKSQGYDHGWQLIDFNDRIQRRLNKLVTKGYLLVRKMNRNYFYQLNPDKYL